MHLIITQTISVIAGIIPASERYACKANISDLLNTSRILICCSVFFKKLIFLNKAGTIISLSKYQQFVN